MKKLCNQPIRPIFTCAARAANPLGGPLACRPQQRPGCARFFYLAFFSLSAQSRKPAHVGAARAPRIPGRNLGLGRDSIRPPRPNLARAWPGQSGPSIQIRRSRAIFAGIKPVAASISQNPNFISLPTFLPSSSRHERRRRRLPCRTPSPVKTRLAGPLPFILSFSSPFAREPNQRRTLQQPWRPEGRRALSCAHSPVCVLARG